MIRSVWKMPFIFNKIPKRLKQNIKRVQVQYNKNLVIIPRNINQLLHIYNGKTFIKILINERMVGHKFGEFLLTRKYVNKYKRTQKLRSLRKKK